MSLDERDFFHQATMRICGSLDIEKALLRCLQYLENFMPITGLNFHLFGPGLETMQSVAQVYRDKTKKFEQVIKFPEEARIGLLRDWGETQGVKIFNRPELDPVTRTMTQLVGKPDRSVMVMRLEIEGERLGAMATYTDGKDRYTTGHARLLSLLHDPLAIAMANAVQHEEVLKFKDMLADDNQYLHQELFRISGDEIMGKDGGLKGVMEMVRQVAPLNSPVLLLGETGVGKEVIANAIHYSSSRKHGPFIKVNCGAIPESLMDSELFGHEKGAFTGATTKKRGRFERAHKGTIFLDEIGELPPAAQIRLLRVLQSKEIERVGGTELINVDIRIIAATHRDLEKLIGLKQFRDDLWFRLNIFPIMIPPLRGRKEDIPDLVHHFIERKSKEMKFHTTPTLDPGEIEQLKTYHWPGNVRELENMVERALINNRGDNRSGPLRFDHFFMTQQDDMPTSSGDDFDALAIDEVISLHIQRVLELSNGKIHGPGGAAELLEINPNTLVSRMRKLGIRYKKT